MPLNYHIDSEESVITIQGQSTLIFDEVRELTQRLFADSHFSPDMSQLVDLRTCRISLPKRSITPIGRYLATHYDKRVDGPVAVVIDQRLGALPTAALYRLTTAVEGAELFDDYGFAVRWLVQRSRGNKPDSRAEP